MGSGLEGGASGGLLVPVLIVGVFVAVAGARVGMFGGGILGAGGDCVPVGVRSPLTVFQGSHTAPSAGAGVSGAVSAMWVAFAVSPVGVWAKSHRPDT